MTRYEKLRDKVRMDLQLTDEDVSDPVMLSLFEGGGVTEGVLETYSRLRGRKTYTIITHTTGTYAYDLSDISPSVFYIEDALYNDLYPEDVLAEIVKSAATVQDQYHNPSLRMIEEYKDRMYEQLVEYDEADWSTYENAAGTEKYLQLVENPETDIVVIYRVLFTKDNFPSNDIDLIEKLYKARVCRYVMGIPQLRSRGDVSYALTEMARQARGFEDDFYNTIKAEDGNLIGRT